MRGDTSTRISRVILDNDLDPWQLHAACAGSPEATDQTRPPRVWDALALCAGCPVIEQCRQWAEDEPDYVGVAGGAVYTTRHRNRRSTTHTIQRDSA